MKLKNVLASVVLLAAPIAAFAAPIKISNDDAVALFGALSQVKDGLTPSNVGAAGEDIYLLKGISDAYASAAAKANRDNDRAKSAKDPIAAAEAVQTNWDNFRHAEVSIDFVMLTAFTDQEIKDAKITPAIIAPIAHFLFPPKK